MTRRVIVIGAPRSGTKILRDSLAQATGCGRVPYDIGFVWRVGNFGYPDDRLEPAQLSAHASQVIRRYVDKRAGGDPPTVIEKTVGNALRVPYVAAVFPDATVVHLVRDGVDAAESIRRQWLAATDWSYVLRKAMHFPLHLAPGYAARYAAGLVARQTRQEARVQWGPKYPGIVEDIRGSSLLALCARQWRWCVELALQELPGTGLPVLDVRYEDLVVDPKSELSRLAGAIGLSVSPSALETASQEISDNQVGAGRRALSGSELAELEIEIGPTLRKLGHKAIELGEGRPL